MLLSLVLAVTLASMDAEMERITTELTPKQLLEVYVKDEGWKLAVFKGKHEGFHYVPQVSTSSKDKYIIKTIDWDDIKPLKVRAPKIIVRALSNPDAEFRKLTADGNGSWGINAVSASIISPLKMTTFGASATPIVISNDSHVYGGSTCNMVSGCHPYKDSIVQDDESMGRYLKGQNLKYIRACVASEYGIDARDPNHIEPASSSAVRTDLDMTPIQYQSTVDMSQAIIEHSSAEDHNEILVQTNSGDIWALFNANEKHGKSMIEILNMIEIFKRSFNRSPYLIYAQDHKFFLNDDLVDPQKVSVRRC